MRLIACAVLLFLCAIGAPAAQVEQRLPSGIRIVIDAPAESSPLKPALVIFYALPNGSTIEETTGRRARTAAEWRYDIQHIAAQTRLLRSLRPDLSIAVAYLEAEGLSWPAWRRAHSDAAAQLRSAIAETLRRFPVQGTRAALVAHSGGGSILFALLASGGIPAEVDRVALLDADYDYSDAAGHGDALVSWLRGSPERRLVVMAYDDRTVTLNGKPVVSEDGGTYRATERMRARLEHDRALPRSLWLDFDLYSDAGRQVAIAVNRNYANEILHTALVGDMNGFLFAMTFGDARALTEIKPARPRIYTALISPCEAVWRNRIPARPAGAETGAAFARHVAGMSPSERETAIEAAVTAGEIPDFLRAFRTVRSTETDSRGKTHTVEFQVAPDYLAIGSDEDFCRIPMLPRTAQRIADALGCALPTRKMVDLIYRAAEIKLPPRPLIDERDAFTTFVQHNAIIEEQRRGVPPGPIVAGCKKDIVVTNLLQTAPHRVAIYGWHRLDQQPIQPLTIVHGDTYVDYSHGVRLVNRRVVIDGAEMDLRALLQDPVLAPVLSDEGVMTSPTYR